MRGRRMLMAIVALAVIAPACSGSASLPPPVEGTAEATTTTAAQVFPPCTADEAALDPTRSYAPLDALPAPGGDMPAGTVDMIKQRGRLIVGVSADTLLFGARNPFTRAIEGFDIDMLKEVALAIFGGKYDDIDQHIEYRVITYAQRLPSLEAETVDIVAHTMTINCNRWLRIAFSSKYFDAGQRVLVKKGPTPGSVAFADMDALISAKATVCAPEGSTNIDLLKDPKYADLTVIGKPDITDCLVALQQGEADALTGDDTVLAGLQKQDPNTEVVGDKFTDEPYGLGINKDQVDFVQFVNAVLEQVRTNGRWKEIYAKWLSGILEPVDPPAPLYGREPSA
jgi:polar amino acid transport system substrate-binding protein